MERIRSSCRDVGADGDLAIAEHRRLFAWWKAKCGSGGTPPASALDLDDLPVPRGNLVVVRRTDEHVFIYDHYGEGLSALTGFRLTGQTLRLSGYSGALNIAGSIADLYVRKYEESLVRGRALFTINQAQINARVHAWERLMLPFGRAGDPDARVLADVRPQAFRHEVLASLSQIAQFGSATLDPVRVHDRIIDYVMIEATALGPVLGDNAPLMLSGLVGPKAVAELTTRLANAADGACVLSVTSERRRRGTPRTLKVQVHVAAPRPIVTIKDITAETAAANARDASERMLQDFLETASDWCWQTDAEHRMIEMDLTAETEGGLSRSRFVGRRRWEFPIVPEDRPLIAQHVLDLEARQPFKDLVYSVYADDGGVRTIRTSGKPHFAADGSFLGYRGTATDVTERKRTERLLAERTEQLREAHRMGLIGTWRRGADSDQVEWSPECFELLRYDPATFDTTLANVVTLYVDGTGATVQRLIRDAATRNEALSADVRYRRGDGTIADFLVTVRTERRADGSIAGVFGTMQDITARKDAERRLEALAFYDPLTGLANRALFKRRLDEAVEAALGGGWDVHVLLLDLDRFKEVNDSLGHGAGDELLTRVGDVLRRATSADDFVARLGGDEFAIVTRRGGADVRAMAAVLLGELSLPMRLSSGEAAVGVSIGAATVPVDAATGTDAMRAADLALYTAKSNGKGRICHYERALSLVADQRLDLGRHLRLATKDGSLSAHYQPQVDLATGRVEGFEALMRWNHPERGPISPAEFIPIAESSGLIVELGAWMLGEACRQARRWIDAGAPPRVVAVNVSPAQFWNMEFEGAVVRALEDARLPPDRLCLELTESLFVDSNEVRVKRTLDALLERGVKIALDDFGTGYSSLGYLTRLPFHRLKIDRRFVDGAAGVPKRRKLLDGIVALGRGLGMTVVAEGAETAEDVNLLRAIGCDVVQGFFFARPAPAATALARAAEIDATAGDDVDVLVKSLEAISARLSHVAFAGPNKRLRDRKAG